MNPVIQCPMCWHEETLLARRDEREPIRDELSVMHWHPPEGGAGAAVVSRWSGGWFRCQMCDMRLTEYEAKIFWDAAKCNPDEVKL